jgi:hypothetical protein
MRQAIRAAAGGNGSAAQLQAAARELVTHLRLQQARPEQMLIRIKAILAEAGITPEHATQSGPATFTQTPGSVYRNVIAWSIRYYYDEAAEAPVER